MRVILGKTSLTCLRLSPSHAQYHATLARSLLPVLALTILSTIAVAVPFLVAQEIAWLRRDTVILPRGTSAAIVQSRLQAVLDADAVQAFSVPGLPSHGTARIHAQESPAAAPHNR